MLTAKQRWYRKNREYAIRESARWQRRNRNRVLRYKKKYNKSAKAKMWCEAHQEELKESRHRRITPEYNSWQHMKGRCLCETNAAYDRYGGRGIRICMRWIRSFKKFLADMGKRPSPEHSLDRKNNDGNYTPRNCRWATALQQRHNRRDSR